MRLTGKVALVRQDSKLLRVQILSSPKNGVLRGFVLSDKEHPRDPYGGWDRYLEFTQDDWEASEIGGTPQPITNPLMGRAFSLREIGI